MQIRSEWDTLREVMVHRPEVEIEYAMLAPRPFLFERVFNTRIALEEHHRLEDTLKSLGVRCLVLKDTVVETADRDRAFREKLERRILDSVRFFGSVQSVEAAKRELERNVHEMDSSTLFRILTLEPSIDLKKDNGSVVEYPTVYSNLPLANLYFMRDQQAVSQAGIIFGNMRKRQRAKEADITEFVFREALGLRNTFRVGGEGTFEGGDFMPAGDFALIGTGPRTNLQGAMQAMSSGLMDFDEVAVVDNPVYDFMDRERDQMANMHLDTFFNIAGKGLAVASVELMKKARVSVYSKSQRGGRYERMADTTLYNYIRQNGYDILDLSVGEQLCYASNFLTVSDRKIVAVDTQGGGQEADGCGRAW